MGIGPLKPITRIYAIVYIEHGYRSFEVNYPERTITWIYANAYTEHGYKSVRKTQHAEFQIPSLSRSGLKVCGSCGVGWQ